MPLQGRSTCSHWPFEAHDFIRAYVKKDPCFSMEDLQEVLQVSFLALRDISLSNICRVIRRDLSHKKGASAANPGSRSSGAD